MLRAFDRDFLRAVSFGCRPPFFSKRRQARIAPGWRCIHCVVIDGSVVQGCRWHGRLARANPCLGRALRSGRPVTRLRRASAPRGSGWSGKCSTAPRSTIPVASTTASWRCSCGPSPHSSAISTVTSGMLTRPRSFSPLMVRRSIAFHEFNLLTRHSPFP